MSEFPDFDPVFNEIKRVMNIVRRIEHITNTDAEHDSDYGAVVEQVNKLARNAMLPESTDGKTYGK